MTSKTELLTSVANVHPSFHMYPLDQSPCTIHGSIVKQCPGSMTPGSSFAVIYGTHSERKLQQEVRCADRKDMRMDKRTVM